MAHENVKIKEQKSRNRIFFYTNRRTVTCIIQDLKEKLKSEGCGVSVGKVQQLKPFPITCPTYKDLTLCLCKVCLNACLILEPLVAQEGKESNNIADSMNAIFMEICTCDKSVNGYYKVVMCTAKK